MYFNKMKLCLIACADLNNGIGFKGTIPWHCKEDLQYFRIRTMGCPVIMGRKTWESIGAKALSGRTNIIVTSKIHIIDDLKVIHGNSGTYTVETLGQAIQLVKHLPRAYIIGGEELFKSAINAPKGSSTSPKTIYLSCLHETHECDKHFPDIIDKYKKDRVIMASKRICFVKWSRIE